MCRARSTPISSLFAAALLACLLGCPGAEDAAVCEDTSGCASGEICEQGRCRVNCVSPGVECPDGTYCQHGVCLPPPVTPLPDAGVEDIAARDVIGAEGGAGDGARVDASLLDASVADAATQEAGASCVDDMYEPNDSADQAARVEVPGQFGRLVSCGVDDPDWYAFTLPAEESLFVAIVFDGALADLDLALYELGATSPLAWSADVGSVESVSFGPVLDDRQLLVQVESWEHTQVSYEMTIDF